MLFTQWAAPAFAAVDSAESSAEPSPWVSFHSHWSNGVKFRTSSPIITYFYESLIKFQRMTLGTLLSFSAAILVNMKWSHKDGHFLGSLRELNVSLEGHGTATWWTGGAVESSMFTSSFHSGFCHRPHAGSKAQQGLNGCEKLCFPFSYYGYVFPSSKIQTENVLPSPRMIPKEIFTQMKS